MNKEQLREMKKGYYWAKSGNYKWWNLIIQVEGDEPFLRINAWNLSTNKVEADKSPYDITELGAQIVNANNQSGETAQG